MKHYFPFTIVIIIGLVIYLWQLFFSNNCLFTFQNHCYTCNKNDVFFVGLPENCTICPNREIQYIDWNNKSIWACLATPSSDENLSYTEKYFDIPCPKNYPLRDILGHCYTCDTAQPVQIYTNEKSICLGKRYTTNYRQTLKSHLCPQISQIKNPEICINCQGRWIDEKCVKFNLSKMNTCQSNIDCPTNQWCFPIHNNSKYSGICYRNSYQNWILSSTEGYTIDTTAVFCARQNAHSPSLEELENEKDEVLQIVSKENIWIVFDEGIIYLESIKTPFPITKEKESIELGGDNTYALCRKN